MDDEEARNVYVRFFGFRVFAILLAQDNFEVQIQLQSCEMKVLCLCVSVQAALQIIFIYINTFALISDIECLNLQFKGSPQLVIQPQFRKFPKSVALSAYLLPSPTRYGSLIKFEREEFLCKEEKHGMISRYPTLMIESLTYYL